MPMYIVLGKFTDEGAKNVRNIAATVEQNMARGEKLGMKVHGWYMTQGRYDFVVMVEGPNDEAMLTQSFGVAAAGMSRTETLRAYPLQEVQQILQQMG